MYRKVIKRILDCIISFTALVVLIIPYIVMAAAIWLDSGEPIVFRQKRLGKDRKEFTIYKFRTMVVGAYENGGIVRKSTDDRITKVGAFLRRTSLDETLQFINVLKGDMSIIGPRPILPVEFEPYADNKRYCKRYEVRPGLGCTIDIKHRASFDRDLQFNMDADYVEKISFWSDIKICFLIAKTVLFERKIYEDDF